MLITTKQELNDQEGWLASQATKFCEDQYITMSILPVRVLKTSHQNWKKYALSLSQKFHCSQELCADTLSALIYYNGFDELLAENTFTGQGAMYQPRGKIEVLNQTLSINSGLADLSFWLYFDTRHFDMPKPTLTVWDQTGIQISKEKLNNRQSHNVYKNWVRISTQFEAHPNYRYQLTVEGKFICIDDLLIKPLKSNVIIKKDNEQTLFNNFILE